MEIADVRYARSGALSIAYQVLGDGPIDLVFAPFMVSTVFTRYVPLIEDSTNGLQRSRGSSCST
ncbi:hypothetical protein NVV43_27615, partial [Escherichia marmotae]|nr:hypothetical protein [Escherichia marmotae]